MAWYRAGGGGIPSSLKTGMNDVLNKKFGTSTTYAPNTWPDNINLMGPLPEKTVSGAIASFSDGADEVPLKSLVCNVDANLSGVSSVGVVQTGRNLLPNKSYLVGANTLWLGDDSAPYYQPLKAGTYTVSLDTAETMTILLYENGSWIDRKFNATTATFTIDHDGSFAIQLYKSTGIPVINNWQLEIGSTATAYTPYVAPTTHTANLGRTIYGGSVDVVNGTGTENYVRIDLGSLTWSNNASYANVFNGALPTGYVGDTTTDFICEDYANATSTTVINEDMSIAFNYGRTVLYCHDNRFSDWSDFKQAVQGKYIVYKCTAKAENFTFDPVPINSFLGDNNLWADTGDTSVTYRADIDLALGGG